jgi:putative membrane protein
MFKAAVTDPGAPLKGANSFTEGQARDRALARGFTEVTGLKKDDDGIWRGSASMDGKSVGVAIDYKGNVVSDASGPAMTPSTAPMPTTPATPAPATNMPTTPSTPEPKR